MHYSVNLIFNIPEWLLKGERKTRNGEKKKFISSRVTCSIPDCTKPLIRARKKLLFTKVHSLLSGFKKPLKSKHRLVHIFQETLYPVRIRHFWQWAITLHFFNCHFNCYPWCPILNEFWSNFKPLTIFNDLIKQPNSIRKLLFSKISTYQ